jgi:hypothetical protein
MYLIARSALVLLLPICCGSFVYLSTYFDINSIVNPLKTVSAFQPQTVPPTTSPPSNLTNDSTVIPPVQPTTDATQQPQQFRPLPPVQPTTNATQQPQQFRPLPPVQPTTNATQQPQVQPTTNATQQPPQFSPAPQARPQFPQIAQQPLVNGPPIGFNSSGTINSLIIVPQTKWIATGTWVMDVNNGNLSEFRTNMSWFDEKGGATHTHEFLNFRPNPEYSVIAKQPDNSIILRGLMDVGTNQKVVWKDVPTAINIKGQNTITISVADSATNNHFASQPILGVVRSFVPCSDVPGAAMEILPPCT